MVRFKVRVRALGLRLGLVAGLGLGLIIPLCRENLVQRVIWQCDIFGMTLASYRNLIFRTTRLLSFLLPNFSFLSLSQ